MTSGKKLDVKFSGFGLAGKIWCPKNQTNLEGQKERLMGPMEKLALVAAGGELVFAASGHVSHSGEPRRILCVLGNALSYPKSYFG